MCPSPAWFMHKQAQAQSILSINSLKSALQHVITQSHSQARLNHRPLLLHVYTVYRHVVMLDNISDEGQTDQNNKIK